MNSENELTQFAEQETGLLQEEFEARVRAKGQVPYLKLPVGETQLEIQPRLPAKDTYKGKERVLILVKNLENQQLYNWTMSRQSPVYRKILSFIAQAPVEVRAVRVGQGQDTKIDIEQLTGSHSL